MFALSSTDVVCCFMSSIISKKLTHTHTHHTFFYIFVYSNLFDFDQLFHRTPKKANSSLVIIAEEVIDTKKVVWYLFSLDWIVTLSQSHVLFFSCYWIVLKSLWCFQKYSTSGSTSWQKRHFWQVRYHLFTLLSLSRQNFHTFSSSSSLKNCSLILSLIVWKIFILSHVLNELCQFIFFQIRLWR